uniref:E74-like factor 2a (ets domain transcription factor) n=1 Tax=Fundulus heteroclitus TaxID=8078 RepID=A0A3Q2SV71_FUNHE
MAPPLRHGRLWSSLSAWRHAGPTRMAPCSLLCSSVEMSSHDMVCFDKTFEAAEALLHMESPGGLHSERSTAEDVMMETVVEVSTECGPLEEDPFPIPPDCEPAAKKKRGGGRKPKAQQPASNGSYDLGIKKRPREGKGWFQPGRICLLYRFINTHRYL